ncbi:timeless protein-domain-containing protein [Lobosporangium transversale]|uniref:Timeless protein-domain-containing protein n=1 Tax=Lobosporangium transversale TaxID=64571 RepID=A0A1Y2GWB1_9FUNG|nr:timeless protein-domain-containing protein [Lobosporangium transversale]ORZ26588.1 timeless protein-domain-containing protein [Lobosporangium transversale]|eukprot:XP_021884351.1 timeless protein-domain-containing protein [Lobosporangium transversale]
MDPDTESMLVSTCLALGGFEDVSTDMDDDRQEYVMGDECLGCLKDIKKFIKYYDEPGDNVVLTFLGKMKILEKDLIPIILLNSPAEDNPVKERLILACIELIVPMTWIIDYKELQKMVASEEDNSLVGNLHQRLELLREYKKAFLTPGVLQAVLSVMVKPLEVSERLRTTRDFAIIRLGLSLLRNLVAIPDAESKTSGTMDQYIRSIMQEELITRFEKEGITALLIFLASSASNPKYSDFNAMTLEILYYMFIGIDPEALLSTASERKANAQLLELLNKEEKAKSIQSSAGRKRHDRFGTTAEIRLQDGSRVVLHSKGSLFKSFESQIDTSKKAKTRTKRHKEFDEYKKSIRSTGLRQLRTLAETLLGNGFNALFGSLHRDIEMMREKIKGYHRPQYYYVMAFMLKFQRLYLEHVEKEYAEQKKQAQDRAYQLEGVEKAYQDALQKCDYDLIAVVIDKTCVFQLIGYLRDHMDMKFKDRQWDEIRRIINCFQEMLMTLYAMTKSPNEDYRDASDIVQNNLYYEDSTLELFLNLARQYSTQSQLYLHTLVRMIHILLKTLESYSKSKSHMFILKKRAIKKRKDKEKNDAGVKDNEHQQAANVGDGNPTQAQSEAQPMQDVQQESSQAEKERERTEDDEENEADIPTHTMHEHQFVFKEFERRFATESVIHTYCAFLENFHELDETQLHWAASMFHRMAVNAKNPAIFYKLSTLHLFHTILQSNHPDAKRDMVPLISYVLHQFFKKMREYPLLMVEVFYQKTSKTCLDINVGREEAEKAKKEISEKREKKLMETELKIDPNQPESEQIKIAVTALLDEDERELVEWVVELLKDAVARRHLMTFDSESELEQNPSLMHSIESVEDIAIVPDNPARQQAIRIMPRFRLLLNLLQFRKEIALDGIHYIIPKAIPTDTLSQNQEIIESVLEEDPKNYSHYDYSALIQKINASAKKKPKRRDESGERREREAVVKNPVAYHSAEYVIDSEDDDESYFEAEKRLRTRIGDEFQRAEEKQMLINAKNELLKNQKRKKKLIPENESKGKGYYEVGKQLKERLQEHHSTMAMGEQREHENNMLQQRQYQGSGLLRNMTKSNKRVSISLADDEDEEEVVEEEGDEEGRVSHLFRFSDSEEDDQATRPAPKSLSDVESNAESDDNGKTYKLSRALPRQQYGVRKRVILSDDSDNDKGGSENSDGDKSTSARTGSLTQRLEAQTAVNNKRRIILADSDVDEDEGMAEDRYSAGRGVLSNLSASNDRPAKKKAAIEDNNVF